MIQIEAGERQYELVDMWTHLERPTDMYVDREGIAYVSELEGQRVQKFARHKYAITSPSILTRWTD